MKRTKLTVFLSVLLATVLFIGCKKEDPSQVVTFAAKSTSQAYTVHAKMSDGTVVNSGDRVPTGSEVIFTYTPVPEKPHTAEWYLDGGENYAAVSTAYICKVNKNTKVELDIKMTTKPDEPSISFSVANEPGEEMEISLFVDDDVKDKVWVDLNNNYIRDEGEDNLTGKEGIYNFKGTVQEQHITVFGPVTWFQSDGNLRYTSMEASGHPALSHFDASKGEFESFTLKDCPRIYWIGLSENAKLTTVELDNLPNLWAVSADKCKISTLKLTRLGTKNLSSFSFKNNNLSAAAITKLIEDLPKCVYAPYGIVLGGNLYLHANPGIVTDAIVAAGKAKNWDVTPLPNVAVTGIKLDKSEMTVQVSENEYSSIEATITPANATNQKIIWTSTDNNVVNTANTHYSPLWFVAKKAGTATVTATTEDGNFKATCKVTVEDKPIPVTGVKLLNESKITMTVGQVRTFRPTISPANATNKNVKWSFVSGGNTIYPEDNGDGSATVTAVEAGDKGARVKVTTVDGGFTAEFTIAVASKATGVVLNHTELTLPVGDEAELIATVQPTDVVDKSILWSRNNQTGYVAYASTSQPRITLYGWKPGISTFTARANAGGDPATCKVTVTQPDIYGFNGRSNPQGYYKFTPGFRNKYVNTISGDYGGILAAQYCHRKSSSWDLYVIKGGIENRTIHPMAHGSNVHGSAIGPAVKFLHDLAWDPNAEVMYSLRDGYLGIVNLSTGVISNEIKITYNGEPLHLRDIEIVHDSRMIGVATPDRFDTSDYNQFYYINKTTGKATKTSAKTYLRSFEGDLTYEPYRQRLYWSLKRMWPNESTDNELRIVNLNDGSAVNQVTMDPSDFLPVMYVPYYPGY